MISLNTLIPRRRSDILTPAASAPAPSVEAIIRALHQNPMAEPFCYIVCLDGRPLQGAFAREPYLLIFAPKKHAQAFIDSRKRLFKPEPLSIVGVDSPSRLRELALTPALDPSYAPPPYGLMLNFVYPSGASGASLSPCGLAQLDADRIVKALSL